MNDEQTLASRPQEMPPNPERIPVIMEAAEPLELAPEEPSSHAGHRKRLFGRFTANGPQSFSDLDLLELLLCYSIPRRDTRPMAQRLLQEFVTLRQTFDAPVSRLTQVEGIGERTAVLLSAMGELWNRSEPERFEHETFLRNTGQMGSYLVERLRGFREERAFVLNLDDKRKLLDCREICRGAVNAVNLPFRKVVESALTVNATAVVLAHNHTTGVVLPSAQDMEYTRELARALSMVQINLVDHIIVADRTFLSMRLSNMMEP